MDLVNAVVGMKAAGTMAKVQYAVAAKILDAQRMNGDAVVKLIQAAGDGVNKAGDELVAAATGLGSALDVYG